MGLCLQPLYNRQLPDETITLRLSCNQIGDTGMAAFAEVLKPTDSNPMGSLGNLKLLVISSPSQVLKDACRGSDLPCRMGGEEFVLVLPGVGVKAGLVAAGHPDAIVSATTDHDTLSRTRYINASSAGRFMSLSKTRPRRWPSTSGRWLATPSEASATEESRADIGPRRWRSRGHARRVRGLSCDREASRNFNRPGGRTLLRTDRPAGSKLLESRYAPQISSKSN